MIYAIIAGSVVAGAFLFNLWLLWIAGEFRSPVWKGRL